MTREEAQRAVNLIKYRLVYDANSSLNKPNRNIIDDIYDDFENRTCENCHFYRKSIRWCSESVEIKGYIDKDFGCNKWEEK